MTALCIQLSISDRVVKNSKYIYEMERKVEIKRNREVSFFGKTIVGRCLRLFFISQAHNGFIDFLDCVAAGRSQASGRAAGKALTSGLTGSWKGALRMLQEMNSVSFSHLCRPG